MEDKELKKLTELARIAVSEEELSGLRGDMEFILGYVSRIQEASVEEKQESGKTKDLLLKNTMREDDTPHEPGLYSDDLLRAVPEKERGYVKVKKIL